MRRASLSLVPPRMYRHFAAVTLALTTVLAMFADGERHQAQAAQKPEPQPTAPAGPPRFANPHDSPVRDPVPRSWYEEAGLDVAFGQPMQRLLDSASSSVATLEQVTPAGIEEEEEAAESGQLTAADREELLRQLRDSRAAAAPPTDAL